MNFNIIGWILYNLSYIALIITVFQLIKKVNYLEEELYKLKQSKKENKNIKLFEGDSNGV